jgi:hypothetical protein
VLVVRFVVVRSSTGDTVLLSVVTLPESVTLPRLSTECCLSLVVVVFVTGAGTAVVDWVVDVLEDED